MIRIVILSYIAVFFPEEPALLSPKTAETSSRGPLAPLYSGKGNAKLYYNEEEGIWVLHCFVKCGTKTAYDYLQEITIGREHKYNSVEEFLVEHLGLPEFIAQYKGIQDNLDYTEETSYQAKKRYIENVYNDVNEDIVDYIEKLYVDGTRKEA